MMVIYSTLRGDVATYIPPMYLIFSKVQSS